MTEVMVRARRWVVALAAAALIALASGLLAAPAAEADEASAAWAVAPADAAGAVDGRTRFDLQLDAGGTAQEQVLITNSSTVERTFAVYGADAFNTTTGGYDLAPAAKVPVDAGSWVTVPTATVTIPALSPAAVPFTVTVPAGATPGDHPGGIVVSLVNPAATSEGVVVDTRVAVRLTVRVPGELTPALEVRTVAGAFGSTLVPFARAPGTVSYEVVNTGNVKIVGKPRIRITGPFGIRLAELVADDTREVLPGQSFTVRSVLPALAPVVVATAVVDIAAVAAPGADTEIPLVSSTGSGTFVAVSWTGLLVVVLVGLIAGYLVHRSRRRRRDGEQLWGEMVEQAGRHGVDESDRPQLSGGKPAARGAGGVLWSLVTLAVLSGSALAASIASAPSAHAAISAAVVMGSDKIVDDEKGLLQLTVPGSAASAPPVTGPGAAGASPVPAGKPLATVPGVTPPGVGAGAVPLARTPAAAAPRAAGVPATGAAEALPADVAGAPGAVPVEAPDAAPGNLPDLVWAAASTGRLSPGQWALVGIGGAGTVGGLGLLAHHYLSVRRLRGLVA